VLLPSHPSRTRREFLRIGAFGAAFTLADQLRARAAGPSGTKPPGAKSAVLIFLNGGPSHLDTYDLKPDAPSEFRGEFKPIKTNVPGIDICEYFPLQAKMMDKLALLRSVVAPADEHSDAAVMTGYPSTAVRAAGHPSFGAVVSKVRGLVNGMPGFMSLRGITLGCEPGFLGAAHRPFAPTGPTAADLRLPGGVTPARRAEQRDLLRAFDDVRRDIDASGAMAGMDAYQQQAVEIVASGRVREALNIAKEPAEVLERYSGAEHFLKARRLVEAGVGCVTLTVGDWDTHDNNFVKLKRDLPFVDRGVSALVGDLHERGLAKDVAVVMWGEFGRTPRINNRAGRDHWPAAMSALVAGGGFKTGQAVGATTARGEQPKERPYTVSQVLATLYKAIGIDPATTFPNATGRPVYVLDDREPVRELL
jgi:uncharacterized protein (DUF1501 family)